MSNMPLSQTQSYPDGEIDLSRMFHLLWKNKWLISIVMLMTLSLGIFYAGRQVPQYQSELLFQIEANRQSGAGISARLPQQLIFGGARNDSETTQIALIKSRFILAPVVESLGLNIRAVPKQSFLGQFFFPSKAKIGISQFQVPRQEVNKKFTLIADRANRFRLYDSTERLILQGRVGKLAKSQDQTFSLLVSALSQPSNAAFYLTKMSDAKIVASLQTRLKITDLGENRQNTGVLMLTLSDPNPESAVHILNTIGKIVLVKDIEKNAEEASKTLDFLNHQLPITKTDLEKSELELNGYRAKSGKIDIKLQAEYLLKQLTDIDKQLGELRINKIDMLQRYTTEHPFIIALKTKIRESKIDRSELEKQLKELPSSDQIAVNLMRDVEVKNALYMLLLNKIQELQVVKAGIVSDVRILSFAKLPHESLPQKRQLIYLASLLLGFLLSLSFVFVRKLLFPLVDDPHWSERHFDLVNVAIVPYSKEQHVTYIKGQSLKHLPLLAYVNPKSSSIESLRSLRTTLQIRLSCQVNNIVSILGVSPGIGKTFVSANIAYLLATAGKRVVVIDTDMRRGTLNKYYNLPPSPGLAEVLLREKTIVEALMPTIHENLMILPRGSYPDAPSELLTSEHFNDLVHMLSEQFDVVVIDTPPVLLVTDAIIISVHAGTNYLVIGAAEHQPAEIEMTIKRLSSAGITLNGSIFNYHKFASVAKNGYGYGYGYSYKYGNYYDEKEASK